MTTNPRDDAAVDWLLAGDPAIRWQALGDLAGASEREIGRERSRIAREGWGARLLGCQDLPGTWAGGGSGDGGLYNPKWTSTTYTMLLLRDLGLAESNRQARRACTLLLEQGLQPDGGIAYGHWARRTHRGETCISGMVLSVLATFLYEDDRLDVVAGHLLDEQMADGGWNCQRPSGATHSSMHTTISVLEGLRAYEVNRGRNRRAVAAAARRGREFLLEHRLFRSHRTGAIIKPEFLRFAFPPRWHYDILRALDHFRGVAAPRDPRLAEAIDIVRGRRQPDGRWALGPAHKGRVHFEMEPVGAPSRWNTLRALRVLEWWDGAARSTHEG